MRTDVSQTTPRSQSNSLAARTSVRDEAAERAGERSGRDEEADALGELILAVVVGQVEGDSLAKEGLADADKGPADVKAGGVRRRRLAGRGDGPDEGAGRDRSVVKGRRVSA
jgi:hypothetical protein